MHQNVKWLALHVMGHLVLHALGWVDTGEDDALLESGIETAMLGRREPDEVCGSVVGRNAVEVVALEVRIVMGPMPRGSDEKMDEIGVLGCRNDFVLLFSPVIDVSRRGFDNMLRQFSADSDTR